MRLRNGFLNIMRKVLVWGMVIAVSIGAMHIGQITANADEKVIRVGYDSNSNFIQENSGEFYGYGVEYLDKIAEYTGWKYEYVKDESWHESLEKLKIGEIDLICTAHYTEERAEKFVYSNIPLGYETTLLYTSPNSTISYQDYAAMNGVKVGLLEDSYSAEEFLSYETEHGVSCEEVYFNRENDMLEAIYDGEIDMLAIGSRYGTSSMQIVDRLGANAFYCIANKENSKLIQEIETVLQQIKFDSPQFEGNLNEKYFGHTSLSHTPLYTEEEINYINSLGVVKVKVLMDQKPSAYVEDGETQGIWVEYLKLISEKSGIEFELEIGQFDENSEDVYNDLLAKNYLLLRTQRAMEFSNSKNIITSIPLMDIGVSYIECQEFFVEDEQEEYVVALTPDLYYIESLLLRDYPGIQFAYYDSAEECFNSLVDKKVDVVAQRTFLTSYLLQKPLYADKLTEVPGPEYENRIHLVGNEEQALLMQILNKAINHISEEEKDEIVTKELLLHPYTIGFDDVWYQSWRWFVGIGVVIIMACVIYTVMMRRVALLRIRKKEYELLQKQIQLDELTGLYNRTYFYEKAKDKIEHSDEEMCIVTMDIANFKVVNELYGVNVGDQLLKEVAEHVQELDERHDMILARFMADHYYLCMPKAEFDEITLPQRFKTFLEEMDVRVVYGVFFIEDKKEMPINVMCDRAFIAVHNKPYKYKEYIHYYNEDERKYILQEQEIENDMEKAIEERQFYIVVQPKYNPQTGKIVGGETLVRWQHPEKGIISPGVFIKVFEKDGFIIQLDYYVWEETCRLIKKMKEDGIETVPISINVSRAHFYGSELSNKLHELIDKYDLETKDIELEITESICGESSDSIYEIIRKLQADGFKIAMDDLGSGYSSLNMLKDMPLDIIKMDLKFLDGEEQKSRQILKALIELAQTMELKVVVEGVEILSQVEFLRQFKDCYLQGYYFSRPVVSDVFEDMLKENQKRSTT